MHDSDQAALDAATAILTARPPRTETPRRHRVRRSVRWPSPPLAPIVACGAVVVFLAGFAAGGRPGLSIPPASILFATIGTLIAFLAGYAAGREAAFENGAAHKRSGRPSK